jgi:phage-related protein
MSTFSWNPDWNVPKQHQSNVLTTKFGDGYEQRQEVGMNSLKQVWNLTFSKRQTTEADAIESFLTGLKGVTNFDWTPPGGSVVLKWKCDLNTYTRTPTSAGRWDLSARFEQVFEP